MLRSLAATALAALLLSLPAAARAQELTGVKPGDQVTTDLYTAAGEQITSVEGNRLVDRDGNIFLPFIGTVHVGGMNSEQIRGVLEQKYKPFYADPVVSVQVLLRVNITGVVGAASHYFLDPTTTIIDALATAGGIGSELETGAVGGAANVAEVRLVRDGQTTILDLRPESITPQVLEMRIQSGDWIHVPPRPRSKARDNILFWGSVISLFSSLIGAIYIVKGR